MIGSRRKVAKGENGKRYCLKKRRGRELVRGMAVHIVVVWCVVWRGRLNRPISPTLYDWSAVAELNLCADHLISTQVDREL